MHPHKHARTNHTHPTAGVPLSVPQQQPTAPRTRAPQPSPHAPASTSAATASAAYLASAPAPNIHNGEGSVDGDVRATRRGDGTGQSGYQGVDAKASGDTGAACPVITYGAPSSEAAIMFAVCLAPALVSEAPHSSLRCPAPSLLAFRV
eukprot:Tamp_20174.p2 GENE.Tamp_20174~~Tamp_20174.p2  ORF type:complete len:149 (+),score=3.49 Tamp_20174:380-826(+)